VKIVNLRSGGVTGGRYAARLAASYSREVLPYPRPEMRDDLLATTQTQRRLKHIDWATPNAPTSA